MERERESLEEMKFNGDKGVELTDLEKPNLFEGRRSMDETNDSIEGTSLKHRRTNSTESIINPNESFVKSNSAESTPVNRQKSSANSIEQKSKSMSNVISDKSNENVEVTEGNNVEEKKNSGGLKPPTGPCTHSHASELSSSDFYICETVNVDVDKFWKTFLRGNFWLEIQKESGLIENNLGEWKQSAQGCCLERELTFVTPLNNRLGPKSTRVTSQHRCFYKSSTVLMCETSSISHDVPYGDAFQVKNLVQATQNPDGKTITIIVGTVIKWSKSVWGMKGIIEKFAFENNKEFHGRLLTLVKNRISQGVPDTPLLPPPRRSSISPSSSVQLDEAPLVASTFPSTTPIQVPLQSAFIAPAMAQKVEEKSLTSVIIQYVGIGLIALAFLLMWMRINSLESSIKIAMDSNFESSNRLTQIESYLDSTSNRKFSESKSHLWRPREVEEKLNELQQELRRMNLKLAEAKAGVTSLSGSGEQIASVETGFHWIFWTLGFALLGLIIFGLLKYKEKVVSFVAPPTPNLHPKSD
eukprot:TRINITY_DN2354_c0_g1_i1.p1 TRINITY_DN2354_c0_g1~~TRINITY_DN2354_c0_g1_i1.p1  ORF type:complete len:527 (-),score=179.18 TRINITY_DN2354_c0_g1_i1:24-1604(-)